ncbi:MAG: hypothetical protein HWN81_21525 [Candidatus Lokiarchaeota archaeon]|nr:hypothetical protein [Candidatus Lokiarchaeota archaeon]
MRWIDPATFHQVFPSSLEFEVTVSGTQYTACLRDIWGSIFGGTSFSFSEKLREPLMKKSSLLEMQKELERILMKHY